MDTNSSSPGRQQLVVELDNVIDEHVQRLRELHDDLVVLGNQIWETWRTLRSSFELRSKFALDDRPHPLAAEFRGLEFPPGLFRWVTEEQVSRERRGSRPHTASAPAPAGRIEELIEILASAGRPMTTDEIVSEMDRIGLLTGVSDQRATVSAALSRGTRLGFLERVTRGTYTVAEGHGDGA